MSTPARALAEFRLTIGGPALLALEWTEPPVPCPRPRRAPNGGVYMPKDYLLAKQALGIWLLQARNSRGLRLTEDELGVACFFFTNRGDVDNLLKTVLDAGTGVLWKDDRQVVESYQRIFRNRPPWRLELLVWKPVQ